MAVGFATVAAAMMQSQAASSAASKAAKAAQRGQDIQERIYLQQREDFAPYRETGQGALQQLGALYGLAPSPTNEVDTRIEREQQRLDDLVARQTQQASSTPLYVSPDGKALTQKEYDELKSFDPFYTQHGYRQVGGMDYTPQIEESRAALADLQAQREQIQAAAPSAQEISQNAFQAFETSPGYQFRQTEGQKAVERAAASRGGRMAGGTLAALQQRGQDIASQEFGNYFNRLAKLAGIGQSATTTTTGLGQVYGQSAANAMNMAGQYQAAGTLGQSQAISGGLTGLAQLYGSGSLGSSSWSAQNPSAWGTVPGSQQSQMLASQWR